MLLCLAAGRIVTWSGQDRVCLTSNRDAIGLGTTGGPVELQLTMRRASGWLASELCQRRTTAPHGPHDGRGPHDALLRVYRR